MEDFSTIIWIVVAVIFSALSSIKRKNQRSTPEYRTPEEGSTLPESWPLFGEMQRTTERTQKESDTKYVSETESLEKISTAEAVSLETIEPEIAQEYAANTSEHLPTTTNRQKTRRQSLQKPQAIRTSQPQLEESPQKIDFDLRKAVIYSEILKPKFEEE